MAQSLVFFLNRKLFLILINLSVLEFPGWKEFHRMDGRRVLGLKTHLTCCVLLLLFCILCPHMGAGQTITKMELQLDYFRFFSSHIYLIIY